MFAVPRIFISKALGEEAENLRQMSNIIKKRVRVVAIPEGIKDAKNFISAVVSPVGFKEMEINRDEIVLTAGNQSKAALLGRNKRRFLEMRGIVKDFFGKEFRII